MRIAVLSNVNLDLVISTLAKSNDVFQTSGYGQWINYALNKSHELATFKAKKIFLLLDGNALFETCETKDDGFAEVENAINIIQSLSDNYKASDVVVGTINVAKKRIIAASKLCLEKEWEGSFNSALFELANSVANIEILDINNTISKYGYETMYSSKMWYMGSIPYSMKGSNIVAQEIATYISNAEQTRKKVLVLDLDNTLWGGVVGEDGPNGIVLSESLEGAAYRDTQKRIKELKDTGVLLAVVSKNNYEDAIAPFNENPHMILSLDDFVSFKANWDLKSQNIRDLAFKLNLGLDSFVFLDDNVIEQEEVKQNLPEVTIIDFPVDIAKLPDTINQAFNQYFWIAKKTLEDSQKTEEYKQEAQRKLDAATASSFEDYLLSLNIKIQISRAQPDQYDRIVQLINKTNQFNTNTIRMDKQEFIDYVNSLEHQVYSVNVSDKYGDSGLVAVALIDINGSVACIQNFLMSCRVMGRQIENAIISTLAQELMKNGIQKIEASYQPTKKNKPVENLWDTLGFKLVASDDSRKTYEFLLDRVITSLLHAEIK